MQTEIGGRCELNSERWVVLFAILMFIKLNRGLAAESRFKEGKVAPPTAIQETDGKSSAANREGLWKSSGASCP